MFHATSGTPRFRLPGLLLLCLAAAVPAAAARAADLNEAVALVPTQYRHKLVQRLSLAEDKRDAWLDAIVKAKPEHREAVAFLLVNMPERDLAGLPPDRLLRDVEQAYAVRAAAPWGAAVPDEVFLNDVIPYSNLNERRDDWRPDFARRFAPLVKDCKTPGEAAQVLNKSIFKQLDVRYHATKRPKPDQSPFESVEAKFASCSGLSILLVDACRAVGVPARVAGTPLWADKSGNHTWTEVWDGRQWRFLGAAEPGPFDKTWFAELASKADGTKPEHRVYAASFRQTGMPFLLVWDPANEAYPAVDVTAYYVARRPLKVSVVGPDGKPAGWGTVVQVRRAGQLVGQSTGPSAEFELGADVTYTVKAVLPDGRAVEAEAKLARDADGAVEIRLPAAKA
ncbi:MAG TPA: transglutaminase domain-containing protein [Humisphaera sp.]